MKMLEILEKDRERLLTELAGAGTAERAIVVLGNEADKMLLRYNEQCASERERDAASYMMQAVRLSLPLMDSVGETKVWERGQEDASGKKLSIPAVVLMVIGIALCVLGVLPVLAGQNLSDMDTDALKRLAYTVGGMAALFVSGLLWSRPKKAAKKKDQHVEVRVDSDKVYRSFRTAILSVDQSLEEIRAAERWNKREQAGSIDGRKATTPEIDLFADLLAASYSQDPEYALEKIDEIKYFLHRQQIEVVDYSEETRQYFDLMPGTGAGTIRPALVADGAVLKKGLASAGR